MRVGRDRRLGYDVRQLTIGHVLADKAAKNGDKVFMTYLPDGRRYSYRDLDRLSNRIANGLLARGVAHGDKVAMLLDNCPEQVLLYFALGKIGAVAVPLNTAARGRQLVHFLTLAECGFVVAAPGYVPRLAEIAAEVPLLDRLIRTGPGEDVAGWTSSDFGDLLEGDETPPPGEVRFSDLAFICYTSGTTGPSKGVMFTQARSISGAINHLEAFGHRFSDVLYVCLPTFHINALTGSVYVALMADASIALTNRFSASGFWADVRRTGATIFNLLGSMVNILWSRPPSPDDADNRVRMVVAAPVPSFALDFEARFGVRIVSGFGLTDYGTPLAFTLTDPVSKLGSVGRVREGWEVRIVDDADFDMPTGEVGEIVMRTNNLWDASSGYYGMPEATVASLRNGWFHTGDRGYVDAEGYFYFLDRKKDVIRRRGENISAFEVEQVLLAHPAIEDAAVYPVRSDMAEDEVAATIVRAAGTVIDEAEVIAHCAAGMAYFMVPRFVQFADDLPRTLSQKVEKYRLQAAADADRSRLWDREAAGIRIGR